MEVECFGDHVWIEPLEAPKKLGGLFLTPNQMAIIEQRPTGMVAKLGPSVNTNRAMRGDPELHVGDIVVFWKHVAGVVQGLNTRHYVYTKEEAIVARILNDPHASTSEMKATQERVAAQEAQALKDASSGPAARIVTASGGIPPGPHLVE